MKIRSHIYFLFYSSSFLLNLFWGQKLREVDISSRKMSIRTFTLSSECNFREGPQTSHGCQNKDLCFPIYTVLFTYIISYDPCKLPTVRSGQLSTLQMGKPGISSDLK